MSDVFDASDVREACESLEKCRDMLLIGLASYGEIERLGAAQSIEKHCGREIPKNLRIIHPTGSAETLGDFAAALINVDLVMRQIRDWAAAGLSRAPEKPEAPPSSP